MNPAPSDERLRPADAERVSDIAPVAWQCEFFRADPSPRWVRELWFSDPRDTYGSTLVRNVRALVPADIIEAQSKALAEMRAIIKAARAAFKAEYHEDGRILSVGYDSEALRPLIAMLDAALTPTPENPK